MSYNMMIGYDIYDCFTMEHFRLRQCHFKIWLDCHKFKKISLPDHAHVNKVLKN
jgi:hypothetical protein